MNTIEPDGYWEDRVTWGKSYRNVSERRGRALSALTFGQDIHERPGPSRVRIDPAAVASGEEMEAEGL